MLPAGTTRTGPLVSGPAAGAAAATLVLSALLSCALVAPARAQIGSDCSDSEPCPSSQECSLGYCRCPQGHVKSGKDCLPEKSFNETCQFDDQCADFRLKCSSEGRCACVKYFHWDEYSKQCITYKDLKYMLNDMEEKYDTSGVLSAETSMVFMGMLWTGLAVMVIGLVLASGCMFYGCCYRRLCCCPRDKLSRSRSCSICGWQSCANSSESTRQVRVQRVQNAPGPARAPSSNPATVQGQTERATSQGTGVDYIPALYQTSSFNVI